jgi:RNA recognition motif-containing protein
VIEINSHHTYKLRGQAWVIFDTLSGATKAQKDLNGFVFYGKPLRVLFAKSKSDVVAKAQGTFVPRPKRKLQEDIDREKEEKEKERERKKQKTTDKSTDKKEKKKTEDSESSAAPSSSSAPAADIPAPPNSKLFVEHLPDVANEKMISELFKFPGYQSCLVVDVPNKGKVAFIQFQEIFQATTAMDALQGFKVSPSDLMKITYAKQ